MKRANILIPGLIILFILILYIPYVLHGGLIVDDWGVVRNARQFPGLINTFLSWFPLFSNRPLAPLILSLTGNLFGANPAGYIIVNIILWFLSSIILNLTFKPYVSNKFHIIFSLFYALPVIASTVIFSPAMQMIDPFSILLWSFSLYFLSRHLIKNDRLSLIISFIFIFLSLLIYEITLPLLVINALLPAMHGKINKSAVKKLFFTYILPILGILGLIFVLQKIIMPEFMAVYSRLTPSLSPQKNLMIIAAWFYRLSIDTIHLLIGSLFFKGGAVFFKIETWVSIGILAAIFILYKKNPGGNIVQRPETQKKLQLILLTALAGTIFLFLLSGQYLSIAGYPNRGNASIWILITLNIAMLPEWSPHIKKFSIIIFIILGLFTTSFITTRDNYIRSYKLQMEITDDVIAKTGPFQSPGMTVIGNVPSYLPENYNNEDLLGQYWDFGYLLSLKSNIKIAGGNTLNDERINGKVITVTDDKITFDTSNPWITDYSNLYFYSYNPDYSKSKLTRIKTSAEFKTLAQLP